MAATPRLAICDYGGSDSLQMESMVTRLTALEEEIGWMVHALYNFADEEISEGCGVRASRWRFAVVFMRNLRNES